MSDDHLDPNALQIEKEQVKTVQFNREDDIITFSGDEDEEEGEEDGEELNSCSSNSSNSADAHVEEARGRGRDSEVSVDVSTEGVESPQAREERSRVMAISSTDEGDYNVCLNN